MVDNVLMPGCLQSDVHAHLPCHQAQILCTEGFHRALHAEISANALFWAAEGQDITMALCESAIQQHPTSCSRGYEREVSTGYDTVSWGLLMRQSPIQTTQTQLQAQYT